MENFMDKHRVKHRTKEYVVNFVLNGLLGLAVYFLFVWLVMPTSWYFQYDSVYVVEPVHLGDQGIQMHSFVNYNNNSGAFHWNDVLRCDFDEDGLDYSAYVSELNTSDGSPTIRKEPYDSPWIYSGELPKRPGLCQVNSTVTKYVYDFIPKKQTVNSNVFRVQ